MLAILFERQFFLKLTGLIATFCLIIAFIAQYGQGILPCPLCLYERYFYGALAFFGILTFFRFFPLTFTFTGVVLIGGLALSIYHLGVEGHWWQASSACVGTTILAGNFDDFEAQFMKKSVARCDQATWVVFGLSATIWNLILFTSLILYWLKVKLTPIR